MKFLQLKDREGKAVKRYQYTAIDDATRIRALQAFPEYTRERAIQFMHYVVERFPFRISTLELTGVMSFKLVFTGRSRTKASGMLYIKPQTPQLNGKVERSHRTDQIEFIRC